MQQLEEALKSVTGPTNEDPHPSTWAYAELRRAAEQFVIYALRTHTGEALRKALLVSAAIADFDNHLVEGKE